MRLHICEKCPGCQGEFPGDRPQYAAIEVIEITGYQVGACPRGSANEAGERRVREEARVYFEGTGGGIIPVRPGRIEVKPGKNRSTSHAACRVEDVVYKGATGFLWRSADDQRNGTNYVPGPYYKAKRYNKRKKDLRFQYEIPPIQI